MKKFIIYRFLILTSLLLLVCHKQFLNVVVNFRAVGVAVVYKMKILSEGLFSNKNINTHKEIEKLQLKVQQQNLMINNYQRFIKQHNFEYLPGYRLVTLPIIATCSNIFQNSIIVAIDAKKYPNLINSPVLGSKGLIGRVSKVSNNKAYIVITNDLNSKVPVVISGASDDGLQSTPDVHAIIQGNGANLKIITQQNVSKNFNVHDSVYTSGKGGVFPKQIFVGAISSIKGNEVTIKFPHNDLFFLNFVTVIIKET